MQYIVITQEREYKIASIIETYKNHILVQILDTQIQKKIKNTQMIYSLSSTSIDDTMHAINNLIPLIDSALLYELIGSEILSILSLSQLYFGDNHNDIQKTALLLKLSLDKTLFHNEQDGTFRRCTAQEQALQVYIVQQQQLKQQQFDHYVKLFTTAYTQKNMINNFEVDEFNLLIKPNKNSIIYKSLLHVASEYKITIIELCCCIGLIKELPDFLVEQFRYQVLAQAQAKLSTVSIVTDSSIDNIPHRLDLKVFSIDDANTTEIDDAFSVEMVDDGYIIGIHIAAPAIQQTLTPYVVNNLSTIYYPGHKITMFPEDIIQQYSLLADKLAPVVSIYFSLDSMLNITHYTTMLNVIKISQNLHLENLNIHWTPDDWNIEYGYPFETELRLLYQFVLKLEQTRGKPSVNILQKDFNFNLQANRIEITPRPRGSPVDKIVSELMILANCSWGRLLTNAFIPAIYRVKQTNYPVMMTLTPNSHIGLNVDYYTWATSPLRRAVDYINQTQILYLINPDYILYNAQNETLLSVVNTFDSVYNKYLDFQNKMERYWSLQYLLQENIQECTATILYKLIAQLDNVPLELDLQNMLEPQPRGTRVQVRIYEINLANLDFQYSIIRE